MKKWVPWILVAVFGGWVLATLNHGPETGFDTRGFARLPVLLNGRIQPMDSVARNSLLQIRSKQAVFLEDPAKKDSLFPQGTNMTATEWLLGVMMKPEVADHQKVFRVDNPEVLASLKLSDREKYFCFQDLMPAYEEIGRQAGRIEERENAHQSEPQNRTPFEKQIMKLYNALLLYQRLMITLRPPESGNFVAELANAKSSIAALRGTAGDKLDMNKPEVASLAQFLSGCEAMAKYAYALVVPPEKPDKSRDNWENVGSSLTETFRQGRVDPVVAQYAAMVTAYRQNRPADFNQALREQQRWFDERYAPEAAKGRREFFFNEFEPFYKAMIIYVTALLLGLGSLLIYTTAPNLSEVFRRSAFWLIALAWVIHTFGLIYRMALEGRPPVTNLYSSAIFIGWGAVVLGFMLEAIFRVGIGSAVASVAGFVTLVIAHNLAIDGDTMEMLRAVLDTNFWLATHVTVVTLGYASTFVAGLLAIMYVCFGFFTPLLNRKLGAGEAAASAATATSKGAVRPASRSGGQIDFGKALAKMVYAIVCFATLFSFVGTVLGGIWADQSWGRFWGWDPKENGALLIVLWNATILHARWGGMVRERGLMNMAIVGNIVTSWSWFGVNMLGIGLHSYGFMDQAFKWLVGFVVSQVLLVILGCLPKRFWVSFREPAVGKAAADAGGRKPAPAVT
jgi:cytochrome c-type biogenesis protein CcsB